MDCLFPISLSKQQLLSFQYIVYIIDCLHSQKIQVTVLYTPEIAVKSTGACHMLYTSLESQHLVQFLFYKIVVSAPSWKADFQEVLFLNSYPAEGRAQLLGLKSLDLRKLDKKIFHASSEAPQEIRLHEGYAARLRKDGLLVADCSCSVVPGYLKEKQQVEKSMEMGDLEKHLYWTFLCSPCKEKNLCIY